MTRARCDRAPIAAAKRCAGAWVHSAAGRTGIASMLETIAVSGPAGASTGIAGALRWCKAEGAGDGRSFTAQRTMRWTARRTWCHHPRVLPSSAMSKSYGACGK
ncbi:hypothetical protein GCM10009095_04100 [Sphingomonas molluscorum]|nr:hypothetical protein GCM10017606_14540 [Microbacterium terregens]